MPPQHTMLPADGRPRTDAERRAQAARQRCKTSRGVWSYKQRMGDAQGVVGELKNHHGLDRARSRGTPLFHARLLVGCTAVNMKRLATHASPAAEGRATGPRTSDVTGATRPEKSAPHGLEVAGRQRLAAPVRLMTAMA